MAPDYHKVDAGLVSSQLHRWCHMYSIPSKIPSLHLLKTRTWDKEQSDACQPNLSYPSLTYLHVSYSSIGYPIVSHPILTHLIHVIFYPILSCHTLTYIMSCSVVSYTLHRSILSYSIMISHSILLCTDKCYHVLSYPGIILSYAD